MTLQKQVSLWFVALFAFCFLLYLFSGVILPFAAGLVLAYLLDPLADRLERIGLSRLLSTLMIIGGFLVLFILLLVLAVPLIGRQLSTFIDAVPGYVQRLQVVVAEQGGTLLKQVGGENALDDMQKSLGELAGQGAGFVGRFLQSLLSGGQALLGLASLLVVTPVVAFYLLLDWDRMVAKVDSLLPLPHRPTIRRLATEIDLAIAGFIRGQALVCLILGLWYGIGLMLVGLNFGLLIGMIAGFISFVPYVGSLTGLVLALAVGIAQFAPDWVSILLILAVFGTGQFLEGNILSPKLVGQSVGLHPVWLMFSLFAFGSLMGFAGLLLAVPLAAALGVLVRFGLGHYQNSPLYRGVAPPDHASDG
jgi:predicted PurR-regulated permease PerM